MGVNGMLSSPGTREDVPMAAQQTRKASKPLM